MHTPIHDLIPEGEEFYLRQTDPFWPADRHGPPELLFARLRRHGYRTFDHLVILYDFTDTEHRQYAVCLCHCGVVFKATRIHILRKTVRHCGCRYAKPAPAPKTLPNGMLDLTGQVFGLLYVVGPTMAAPATVAWRVTCACGITYTTPTPATQHHCGAPLCNMLYRRNTTRNTAVALLAKLNKRDITP